MTRVGTGATPGLVALDLPGGSEFIDGLRRVWDRGDAVFPIDQRLPPAARQRLVESMAPTSVIDGMGETSLPGGRAVEPGDALVMATSGSSGTPKGVVLTHAALNAHARGVHARLGVDAGRDRWLACLPLAHMGGLGVAVRALVDGVGLDVLPRFDTATVAAAPVELGTTLTSLVPTALDRLPAAHGFRWVVLGGSGDPTPRPSDVVHTYGLTETGGGIWYSSDGLADGPLDGTELRIVDDEIEVRGPTLMRGYRDGTDPPTVDGWLSTGDLGAWDDEGGLVVHGRTGDLIVSGGENVWPGAVESALSKHPAVAEVAVVGVTDREWGQRVVAHVVPVAGGDPPTLGALAGLTRDAIGPWAAPKELVLMDSLPRTALGKVRRDQLGNWSGRRTAER